MLIRFAAAFLSLALACTIALAQDAAQPAATQPDLPGQDCDLRAAVALADSIVVAKAADIDSTAKTMQNREGNFGWANLSVTQWLKGHALDAPAAFLPIATADDANPPRVAVNVPVIMFIARDGSSPILFKALAADDATIAAVADLIKMPPAAEPASALRCDIVVSNPPASQDGTLLAALELTNSSDDPIRICFAGSPANDLIVDDKHNITGSDIRFEAAKFKAAAPSDYELARQIVTIPAKQSFLVPVGYTVPETGAITLTGHFTIPQSLADKLNLWPGALDAPPHTVFLKPATEPAQP